MSDLVTVAETASAAVHLPTLPPSVNGLARKIQEGEKHRKRHGWREGIEIPEEQRAFLKAQAEQCLTEIFRFSQPATRKQAAVVLGELALRYFRQEDLTTEQLKVLYGGYHDDLSDVPASLWQEMGKRYRNTPGKRFFPQTWELRDTIKDELEALKAKEKACHAVITELENMEPKKPGDRLMTPERLAELKEEMGE